MAGPQAVGFQLRSLLKFLAGADVVALALKSKRQLPVCLCEIGIRSDCCAQLFDGAFDVARIQQALSKIGSKGGSLQVVTILGDFISKVAFGRCACGITLGLQD